MYAQNKGENQIWKLQFQFWLDNRLVLIKTTIKSLKLHAKISKYSLLKKKHYFAPLNFLHNEQYTGIY